jgi:hypothetical protein
MILNSLEEPSAESEDITGVVLPGLCLDGLRQKPRQRHCDRLGVLEGKQQGYGIATLVEKFQLYGLAIVKRSACRELAAADDHGRGSRLSLHAGLNFAAILNPLPMALGQSSTPEAAIAGKAGVQPDDGHRSKRLSRNVCGWTSLYFYGYNASIRNDASRDARAFMRQPSCDSDPWKRSSTGRSPSRSADRFLQSPARSRPRRSVSPDRRAVEG